MGIRKSVVIQSLNVILIGVIAPFLTVYADTNSSALPASEITGGFRAGDGQTEGFGDILAPVYSLDSGLFFVNPRASYNDDDEEEYNIGLGYRHLLSKKYIVGANVYYDYRDISGGKTFNQMGLGAEFLSDWFDARINYYRPEDKTYTDEHEEVSVTSSSGSTTLWQDPYAEGNGIYQDGLQVNQSFETSTRQFYEQKTKAMEGFDVEAGVRIPIPKIEEYIDFRVFGGYYYYNAELGQDDVEGFKGRAELRCLPALVLDAEVYENKDLTGSDYYVGARAQIPFDMVNLVNGKNPFEGTFDRFKPRSKRPHIASRMTEMVMRDLHVNMTQTKMEEMVGKRESSTVVTGTSYQNVTYTVADDVTFVDVLYSGIEEGTKEHPYNTITEGIDNNIANKVFVETGLYQENITVPGGMWLWSKGAKLPNTKGNKQWDLDVYPVINGIANGPTIRLGGNGITIAGFGVAHSDTGSGVFVDPVTGEDITKIGIYGYNVSDISLNSLSTIFVLESGVVISADSLENMRMSLTDVSSRSTLITGEGIGTGTFSVDVKGGEIDYGKYDGITINAEYFDVVDIEISDLKIEDNDGAGLIISAVDINKEIDIDVSNCAIMGNNDFGLGIGIDNTASLADSFISIKNCFITGNASDGAFIMGLLNGSDLDCSLQNIVSTDNDGVGLDVSILAFNGITSADVNLNASGIQTLRNNDSGFVVDVLSGSGNVNANLDDITAKDNAGLGLELQIMAGGISAPAEVDFTLNNAVFSGNGADGLGGVIMNYEGDTSINLQNVESRDNTDLGISIAAMCEGAGATIQADFQNCSMRDNGDSGMESLLLSMNGNVEVFANAMVASGNSGLGMAFSGVASGAYAVVEGSYLLAENNGAAGVEVSLYNLGGVTAQDLSYIRTVGNTDDGLQCDIINSPTVYVQGEHIQAINNDIGVIISVPAGGNNQVDFGGGELDSEGQCSIYNNGFYDLAYDGTTTMQAEYNWWGSATPNPAQFFGNIDYTPWLSEEP